MDDWQPNDLLGPMGLGAESPGAPAVAQRKSAGAEQTPSASASGGGRPMPEEVQSKMEHAFGADFSAVRVHEGTQASAMGAHAYTQGNDIHFAPGQYDPSSQRGQELLGHELSHVVQQSQGRVSATTQSKGMGVNDDAGLERQADEMGARAARGESVGSEGQGTSGKAEPRSSGAIQRKPTTSQAGTVAEFIQVFNNTPSGMGATTGRAAHDAMLRLGETEMTWTGPLPKTTPYFNQRSARYIYTTQGGWMDMVHFLFHAGRAYKYLIAKRDAAKSLAEIEAMPWYSRMWMPPEYMQMLRQQADMSPVGESVQEGFQTERMQQVLTPNSAFSYEDLPSDTFGARFAVQHFNPNSPATFAEQLATYLNGIGALEPEQAPNFSELPTTDDGVVDRQNFTTTPVYTEANP